MARKPNKKLSRSSHEYKYLNFVQVQYSLKLKSEQLGTYTCSELRRIMPKLAQQSNLVERLRLKQNLEKALVFSLSYF